MRNLFVVAAGFIVVSSATSCAAILPWRPEVYPNPKMNVRYVNSIYTNTYYADQFNPPYMLGPWELKGSCDAGTAHDFMTSCSSYSEWSSAKEYTAGSYVHYAGRLFQTNYWAGSKDIPGSDVNWKLKGFCQCSSLSSKSLALPSASEFSIASGVQTAGLEQWPNHVFAPYVDVGYLSQPNITDVYEISGTKFLTLSSVGGNDQCEAAWGGKVRVVGNNVFADQIDVVRSLGGDISVSFGGKHELADIPACQDGSSLALAYLSVIDTLHLTHIDFHMDYPSTLDKNRETGWTHRFEAVSQIQHQRPSLRVSWTLNASTEGLTETSLSFAKALMQSGVRLDVINLNVQNFGPHFAAGRTLSECEVLAVDLSAVQLFKLANELSVTTKLGWTSSTDVYAHLGSSPMIGTQYIADQTYTLADAANSLSAFKVRGVAMWSPSTLNRDAPCASPTPVPTCSGGNLQEAVFEFASIMSHLTS